MPATPHLSPHVRAVLQALFITFLWSTSWVLIKIGLNDENIPALTFAGLRYTLAFTSLIPFLWRSDRFGSLRQLSRRQWGSLVVYGLLLYAVAQGAQFLALDRLPAVSVSLILSFTAVMVALLGAALLAEWPGPGQWLGLLLYLAGALVYFYPVDIPTDEVLGLLIAFTGALSTSLATVFGRGINRSRTLSPLTVTLVSMGIGSLTMLAAGLITEGIPTISWRGWALIAWLAFVNTAFTFTLWNHTQRTLSAVETSTINNTMLIQIAILALIFLGESLSARDVLGLALAAVGTLLVQLRRRPLPPPDAQPTDGTSGPNLDH